VSGAGRLGVISVEIPANPTTIRFTDSSLIPTDNTIIHQNPAYLIFEYAGLTFLIQRKYYVISPENFHHRKG
jgi:hypothetical protein